MSRRYFRDSVTGRPYDPVTKAWLDEEARDAVRGEYNVRAVERSPEQQVMAHAAVSAGQSENTVSYRERIHAQQYLNEQREEFPNDPWRYAPTAIAKGLTYADLNDRELLWLIEDMTLQIAKMEAWGGTPYTPEAFAERRAILAEMQAARRG